MVIHWNKPDNPFRSFSVLITVLVTYLETDAERGYWRSDTVGLGPSHNVCSKNPEGAKTSQ